MDSKLRPRKKRGASRNAIASPNYADDEMWRLSCEKEELECVVKDLSDKLASALSKLYLQDDLIKKHEMMVADSVAGWEEAEAKVYSLQQELDEAHHERVLGEQRMARLESALDECMQQLQISREEQGRRIKSEASPRLSVEEILSALNRTRIENGKLAKALLDKSRVESDFTTLATVLESTKKENASLRYEIRHLINEHDKLEKEWQSLRTSCHASEPHLTDGIMSPDDSISKLIELLEGIKPVPTYCYTGATSEFAVRIFQWKASELRHVSDRFMQTCYALKNGDTDANRFVKEVGDSLEWVINHCFSIQDVPSMKDDMVKRLEWEDNTDETPFETSKRETRDSFPKVSCFSEESENRSCCSEELPAKPSDNKNSTPATTKSSLRHKMMEEDEMALAQSEGRRVNYNQTPQASFVSNDVLDHLEKILKETSNGVVGRKGNGGLWKKLWRKMKSA